MSCGCTDEQIARVFRAILPVDYSGNTLGELPSSIASARAKKFDQPSGKSKKRRPTPVDILTTLLTNIGAELILRKTRHASRPASVTSRRRDWVEVPVGRMRLFIKGVATDTGGLQGLIPIVCGDVLASVSRRDPRRRAATVWTSGNRIFRTDNPRLVLEAALAHSRVEIGAGAQPALWGSVREREALARVAELIGRLAEREADEERGAFAYRECSELWKSRTETFFGRSQAIISG